jgi:hypothetical protein
MTGRGIFCIETTHWGRRGSRQPSVRHLLRLIEGIDGTPFIHRQFSTWEELCFLLTKATRGANHGFPVLYLASHGTDYGLTVSHRQGKKDRLRSIDLAKLAAPLSSRGAGRVLFVSACEIMRRSRATLRGFLEETQFEAIAGYGREVSWLESAQLELGLLAWLGHGFDGNASSFEEAVRHAASSRDLMRRLDLRFVLRKKSSSSS